jgi:hypothetical protein
VTATVMPSPAVFTLVEGDLEQVGRIGERVGIPA